MHHIKHMMKYKKSWLSLHLYRQLFCFDFLTCVFLPYKN